MHSCHSLEKMKRPRHRFSFRRMLQLDPNDPIEDIDSEPKIWNDHRHIFDGRIQPQSLYFHLHHMYLRIEDRNVIYQEEIFWMEF